MKKGLLLFLGMLMMVSTVEATDGVKVNSTKDYYNRYGTKTIKFLENGIKFYVYPNGEFDFNTNVRSRYTNRYVYRNGQRYNRRFPYNSARISRDYLGRIKRIGRTSISYNRYGKISRIGSKFIDYRHRRMTRVGGLQIKYNRYGNVQYFGHVKNRYNHYDRTGHFIGSIFDYNDAFFYDNGFYNDYEDYGEDDDYYYYKSKKGKQGTKKGKIIKRKKLKKDAYDDDYKERKRRK